MDLVFVERERGENSACHFNLCEEEVMETDRNLPVSLVMCPCAPDVSILQRIWSLKLHIFKNNRTHNCKPSTAWCLSKSGYYISYYLLRGLLQKPYEERQYLANKGPSSQRYGFSSSHVWMWELDYKESWGPTNWCFWTVVLEKTLESPLDCKEIQPVHPKGDQSWVFIGKTDVEAETLILWPPAAKSWLIWKDPDAGKDWRHEKGTTEDEMVGWHHRLNGHGFG